MKKNNKMYSIKKIKGKLYVYSWSYIPRGNRKKESKRFDWYYQGPIDGKGGDYIKRLDMWQQKLYRQDMKFIELKEEEQNRIKDSLLNSSEYALKKQQIDMIDSSTERKKMIAELNREINKEARALSAVMFNGMDATEFRAFISDGGTIKDLRERIHI